MYRLNLIILAFIACQTLTIAADSTWQAGVATADITPARSMWMSGYGGRDHPSEGKLTDLWAKALVLQDGGAERVAAVTLDLVGLDRLTELAIRKRIESEHGIPLANSALLCSHTHTGPVVGSNLRAMYSIDDDQWALVDEYTAGLIDDVVAAVGAAIDDLEPARLTWGTGETDFAVNRRNNREADVPMLRAQGLLKGPVDHDVPVLAVHSGDELKAVVFGYACHATVLSFYQFSGDYPGFAQIDVEETHPGAIAMFWAGCGADQNPLPRRTPELAMQYGRRLADAVEEVLQQEMHSINGGLATDYAEIDLNFASLPSRAELEAKLDSDDRFDVGHARHLLKQWDANGELSSTYPYPVQTWKLGGGPTWVHLGGEVVVDFSLRLKSELGPDDVWVAGYANDVMAYIPSLRVLREGGYEGGGAMRYYGQPSPWAEDVEELIVGEVHRQVRDLGAATRD
jgi:hypothetical protein